MHRSVLTVTGAAAAALLLAGCGASGAIGGSSASSAPSVSGSSSVSVSGTVTVFAAASLKEAFTKLGHQFRVSA